MSNTPKTIANEVLTPARVRELWTANYLPALPFTPQNFDIGTLLPAMLYMARWGQRRGKGAFKEAFGKKIKGLRGFVWVLFEANLVYHRGRFGH